MNELQQRFSDFLEKLLAKAEELTNEVKITIQETYDSDIDAYKRNFFKMFLKAKSSQNIWWLLNNLCKVLCKRKKKNLNGL